MKRIAPLALLALTAFVDPLAATTPPTSLILSGVPVVIDGDTLAKEQRCLAEAIYFEARSEGEDGRVAVAQVVLNRVRSGTYPGSVCGVVYQNRNRHLACQFSFACTGKSLRIKESEPWEEAVRIARDVYEGRTYLEEVGASTHYHADYVQPDWAKKLKKMDVIGRHIFYS
ncbi:cell wall hydrolase [Bosea sp. BK604]|nr:cell wall hydrolase [Bosea sp. BK604]